MSAHTAAVAWQRGEQRFVDNRYSRRHEVAFDATGEQVSVSADELAGRLA